MSIKYLNPIDLDRGTSIGIITLLLIKGRIVTRPRAPLAGLNALIMFIVSGLLVRSTLAWRRVASLRMIKHRPGNF
jgi:hypothetical protein